MKDLISFIGPYPPQIMINPKHRLPETLIAKTFSQEKSLTHFYPLVTQDLQENASTLWDLENLPLHLVKELLLALSEIYFPWLIHHHLTVPFDKICFFAGSFNPWHKGHQACIDLLPANQNLIIAPDLNPQKELLYSDEKLWLNYQGLIKNLSHKYRANVYPGFLALQKANPTIDWTQPLKKGNPQIEVSLLMGFDQFKNFNSWKNADQLAQILTQIFVVSRLEDKSDFIQAQSYFENKNVRIVALGHHNYETLSSTALRSKN